MRVNAAFVTIASVPVTIMFCFWMSWIHVLILFPVLEFIDLITSCTCCSFCWL